MIQQRFNININGYSQDLQEVLVKELPNVAAHGVEVIGDVCLALFHIVGSSARAASVRGASSRVRGRDGA